MHNAHLKKLIASEREKKSWLYPLLCNGFFFVLQGVRFVLCCFNLALPSFFLLGDLSESGNKEVGHIVILHCLQGGKGDRGRT